MSGACDGNVVIIIMMIIIINVIITIESSVSFVLPEGNRALLGPFPRRVGDTQAYSWLFACLVVSTQLSALWFTKWMD